MSFIIFLYYKLKIFKRVKVNVYLLFLKYINFKSITFSLVINY
jgi:hypothetical protein